MIICKESQLATFPNILEHVMLSHFCCVLFAARDIPIYPINKLFLTALSKNESNFHALLSRFTTFE
jgi:hypothetical protein